MDDFFEELDSELGAKKLDAKKPSPDGKASPKPSSSSGSKKPTTPPKKHTRKPAPVNAATAAKKAAHTQKME